MTRPHLSAAPSPPVRRPPAPSRGATVTRLSASPPDEPVETSAVQGTLALDLGEDLAMPLLPQPPLPPPDLRVVADRRSSDDVRTWAGRFAQAVIEVLGGDRPLTQLIRWTSTGVYADLGQRVTILGRTAPAGQRRRTIRPQVRTVHVFQPSPAAAEVSVHVRYGQRSRAIAARLELERGRWQCTDLQLG